MDNKLLNEKFTEREKITRAITLELSPVGNTRRTFDEKKYLEYDVAMAEMVNQALPFFDRYITDAQDKAMAAFSYDWAGLMRMKQEAELQGAEGEEENKQALARRKAYTDEKEALKKKIVAAVLEAMEVKKPGDIESKQFIHKQMPFYLRRNHLVEEADRFAVDFQNVLSLFAKKLKTKETAIEVWIPERIIENFERYAENLPAIKRFLESKKSAPVHKNFEEECDSFSVIDGYAFCATRAGISSYNNMLSGIVTDKGMIKKGMLVCIRELNTDIRNKDTGEGYYALPKKLNKQILAPAEKQYTVEKITGDEDVVRQLKASAEAAKELAEGIEEWAMRADKKSLSEILVDGSMLHRVSHTVCGEHDMIPLLAIGAEREKIEASYAARKMTKRQAAAREKKLRAVMDTINKSVYSVNELQALYDRANDELDFGEILRNNIMACLDSVSEALCRLDKEVLVKVRPIHGNSEKVRYIREYANAVVELRTLLCSMAPKNKTDRISLSSDELREFAADLKPIVQDNERVRSYLVKKPDVAAPRIRTCFGSAARFRGKYHNGIEQVSTDTNVLLEMDDKYYLFLVTGEEGPLRLEEPEDAEDAIKRLEVNRMAKPMLNIPSWVFPAKQVGVFFAENPKAQSMQKSDSMLQPVTITREVYDIFQKKLYTAAGREEIGEEKYRECLTKFLETVIEVLKNHVTASKLRLEMLKKPEEYRNFLEFINDMEAISTSMAWKPASRKQILSAVERGGGLLFLITNQNMYKDIKHGFWKDYNKTSYAEIFLAAMSEENVRNIRLLLNSRPEYYFRPASLEPKVAHKKGSRMLNKHTMDGRYIPEGAIRNELKRFVAGRIREEDLSAEAYDLAFCTKDGQRTDNLSTTVAQKDLIHKESLTRDMFLVVFSYVINSHIRKDTSAWISEDARKFYREEKNILSVARNSSDLLYYTVTDRDGRVLEEKSLNRIGNTDFKEILSYKTLEKQASRKEWNPVASTEEIKETLMRLATHDIVEAAIRTNSVVVVEWVSDSKKSGNKMFDDRVYADFTKRLQSKMAAYCSKDVTREKGMFYPGGRLNPIQLAASGVQSNNRGFLQEISGRLAIYMCPETGFVNTFRLKEIDTHTARLNFLKKMKEIKLENGRIEYTFDYNDFRAETSMDLPKSVWTVFVEGTRNKWSRSKKEFVTIRDVYDYAMHKLQLWGRAGEDITCMLDDFTKEQVKMLFDMFKVAAFGSMIDEDGKHYYVSPVTGNREELSRHSCIMLARKYRFAREYWDREDEKYKGGMTPARHKEIRERFDSCWLKAQQNVS